MQGPSLKILHVIAAVAPRYGGPSQLVLEMCAALNEAGHRAEIVTSNADGKGVLAQPLHQFVNYKGVRCLFFNRKYGEGLKYSPGLYAWLRRQVAEYDLVHIHGVFSWSSFAASKACQTRSVPYILRPLGSLDPWSLRHKATRKKILMWLWVQRMVNMASCVHYTSEREQHASESGQKLGRGIVIPNGVEVPHLAHGELKDLLKNTIPELAGVPYILFLGRLVPKKKLELLIRSFSRLSESRDRKLVIAGTGDSTYIEKLKYLVAETKSVDHVVFPGWVEGEIKAALLGECALFVLISDNENYGISVAEAMAAGRAVIVNKNVYLYDQVQQARAGWVIENEEDLDKVLSAALRDDAECERRGKRGSTLVRDRLSWNRVISQLEQVYRACKAAT